MAILMRNGYVVRGENPLREYISYLDNKNCVLCTFRLEEYVPLSKCDLCADKSNFKLSNIKEEIEEDS